MSKQQGYRKLGLLKTVAALAAVSAVLLAPSNWNKKFGLIENAHAAKTSIAECKGDTYLERLQTKNDAVDRIFKPITDVYHDFEAHLDIEVRSGKATAVSIRPTKLPKKPEAILAKFKLEVFEQQVLAVIRDLKLPSKSCVVTVRYGLEKPTQDETEEKKGKEQHNSPGGNPRVDEGGVAVASL